jgi:hypothetical protein
MPQLDGNAEAMDARNQRRYAARKERVTPRSAGDE